MAKYSILYLSFPPSHNMVKGLVAHACTTSAFTAGARACMIIDLALVLPQVKWFAIMLSGNIFLHNLVK